jgi:tetratricopeptide (TPR) repeat protein
MVAKTYQKAKIASRYVEMLDKALAIDSVFEPALRDKAAYLYYKEHDYEKAVAAYEKLLKHYPAAPVDDKMLYANSLFLAHQYPKTIEWVDRIILEDGSKNYLRRLAAYSSYETGEYEKGLSIIQNYFSQVTPDKIIPQDYEYYGKLLQKNEKDSLAAIQYEQAILMDSSRWELYDEIGKIEYGLGNYPEAVKAYQHRLDSLSNPSAMDYYRIGVAYYAQQDSAAYEAAAKMFAMVSESAPTAAVGWLMQAKTLAKLEPDLEKHPELESAFGRAQPAFEKYVEIAAADPEKNRKDLVSAYEYLVYYHYVKDKPDAARPLIEDLLTLEPANATALEINKLLDE